MDEVEQLWRHGLELGEPEARAALADLLMQQDRQDELDALWREGIARGEPDAWPELVNAFRELGRPAKAEQAWHEAAAAGHPVDRLVLAGLLDEQEKLPEAETLLRDLAKTSRRAAHELAELLDRQGKTDEVERLWRDRLAGGDLDATKSLCDLLEEQGRMHEVEQLLRAHAEQRGRHLDRLLNLMTGQHRDGEVENLLRQHVESGDGAARSRLIGWLDENSRPDDAEQLLRAGAAAGQKEHLDLAHFLRRQGRLPEAEQAFRVAVSSGEYAAWWGLIELLQETGRSDEADRLMRHGMDPICDGVSP